MSRLHRIVGYTFIAVFLGTGVYMRVTLPPPAEDRLEVRMARRAIHVYILLTALLNVVASSASGIETAARRKKHSAATNRPPEEGAVHAPPTEPTSPLTPESVRSAWRLRLQTWGHVSILFAPLVLTTAFFVDPTPDPLTKPVSLLGVLAALVGAVLLERTTKRRRVDR